MTRVPEGHFVRDLNDPASPVTTIPDRNGNNPPLVDLVKHEWTLRVEYPNPAGIIGINPALDERLEAVVGKSPDATGSWEGGRELFWIFDTEQEMWDAQNRLFSTFPVLTVDAYDEKED